MDLSSLLQNSPQLINTNQIETTSAQNMSSAFSTSTSDKSFESAISNAITEANVSHLDADEAIKKMASGEDVDLHGTMIAIEKAGIATRLTIQVRNKALEAYKEIMNMQV